jgi:serine/threonine protein kinase/tetratricopeptide (TPR) repeat protein
VTPEHWREIEQVFHSALERGPNERTPFLDEACRDPAMRKEVEALLKSDAAYDDSVETLPSMVAASWMSDDQNERLVGQIVGRYKILGSLGSGGMGQVYLADDASLGRKVALKFLPSQFTQDQDRLRRFEQEARNASALNHPNIITIHEIGQWNGTHFIVTEFVEGKTLRERMQSVPLPLSDVVEIGIQIAGALAAAHAAGIIHRDIKPANIMVRADGYVKVLDFGLAKLTAPSSAERDRTDPGHVMGTVGYMSPEQALGKQLDHRTDIFSLGVVLYEMATGSRPFDGDSDAAVYDAILHKAPPSNQKLINELGGVIRHALEKEPAARYETASELRADLKQIEAGAKLRRSRIRRSRGIRFAFALAALLLALAAFWLWRAPNRPGKIDINEKSIAVLPFDNLSADKANAYFASGMQDEILTKLAQLGELKVVSRASTEKYQKLPRDLRAISRELNVATVLEGSVQRSGDDVLINVQLIDLRTDTHLWAESYQRKFENIFDVEAEVARRVADALKVKIASSREQRLLAVPTTNPHAHDLFLRAHALGAHSDEQSLERKIELLRQAVEEDPNYAMAWGDLAGAYLTIADAYRAPREVLDQMRHAALMSIQSDDKASVGHIWLGAISMLYDRNFPLAKRELERAVALDPNSSDAHRWFGWYLARIERNFVGGRAELQRARSLDPFYTWPLVFESAISIAQGDNQAALQFAERIIEIDSRFFYDVDPIANVYAATGRWQDAVKRYESLAAGTLTQPNFELAICYAHLGDIEHARQIGTALESLATKQYIDQTHIAAIYAALGDKDKAFFALDRACEDRSARASSPRFFFWLAPLFDDPRFAALENKVAHSAIFPAATDQR